MAGNGDKTASSGGRLVRAANLRTPAVRISFDGMAIAAQEGESILAAVLRATGRLRRFEFAAEDRAGFCLMGACQDCWVWLGPGTRARACTTPVEDGMAISSRQPDGFPRDA
jgi:predicted molibdopterin-dependent oxidoreductase YjgC